MDRAPYLSVLPTELVLLRCTIQVLELLIICHIINSFLVRQENEEGNEEQGDDGDDDDNDDDSDDDEVALGMQGR